MVIRAFADYTHKVWRSRLQYFPFSNSVLKFRMQLETLRKFVMINVLAIIKITKKHDKHSRYAIQSELVRAVHDKYFYRSEKFGTLITDVEVLAMQLMSRLADQQICAENLVCPSCVQVLCNPIMLPCGHRFCMRCVSASSYFKKGYRCPVCLKEHTLDLASVRYGSMLSCPSPSLGSMSWRTPACDPDAGEPEPPSSNGRNRSESVSPRHNGVAGGGGGKAVVRCEVWSKAAAGGGGMRRMEAERAIEDSILRTAVVPDLSQAALSMSPDSVDGFALVETLLERQSRALHSVTGMAVRAVAGRLEVPPAPAAARSGGWRAVRGAGAGRGSRATLGPVPARVGGGHAGRGGGMHACLARSGGSDRGATD